MSPEKQQIAIAEACGWSNLQYSDYKPLGLVGRHPGGSEQNLLRVPDYLNNLNAMREATMARLQGYEENFFYELSNVVNGEVEPHLQDDMFCLANATAAQRAEAFLRTIGKWKEASK